MRILAMAQRGVDVMMRLLRHTKSGDHPVRRLLEGQTCCAAARWQPKEGQELVRGLPEQHAM